MRFCSEIAISVILFLCVPVYAQTDTAVIKAEDQYWRRHYPSTPYYSIHTDYAVYAPAYHYGVKAFALFNAQRWENIDQLKLSSGWLRERGNSTLTWDQAQNAARDAYMRMYDNHHQPADPKAVQH